MVVGQSVMQSHQTAGRSERGTFNIGLELQSKLKMYVTVVHQVLTEKLTKQHF